MITEPGRFTDLSSYAKRDKMTVKDALDRPVFRYLDERIDKAEKQSKEQKAQIGCLWGVIIFLVVIHAITHLVN